MHGGDVLYDGLLAHRVHQMNGVFSPGIDVIDDIHVHIREDHMVSGLLQQHADEAATDLACADHNSLFHDLIPLSLPACRRRPVCLRPPPD